MSEFADDVYQPDGDNDGQPEEADPDDTLLSDDLEEVYDTDYSPPDRQPQGSRHGTTALEEFEGESLDQRLAEEEPDVSADDVADDDADPRAGRLVAPDEGAHPDEEKDEVAFDAGTAGYAASAEEAAVHVIDE